MSSVHKLHNFLFVFLVFLRFAFLAFRRKHQPPLPTPHTGKGRGKRVCAQRAARSNRRKKMKEGKKKKKSEKNEEKKKRTSFPPLPMMEKNKGRIRNRTKNRRGEKK
eukprot:TRINITY_DN10910_c0_g2_i7.p2 TRINITY_DN10910_c0_g2~~TRINITY_DN10910_c0_g2_i7.p2  ORF type:complete len:107 (+),score=6.89 TRINITY_DN10910_c0_g2_i7:1106-1426(+)